MRRRTLVGLALLVLGIAACVDVPNHMRAEFAPAGPNDRTNYRAGSHGSAPPITAEPMLPWDAGMASPVGDAGEGADAAAPVITAITDGGVG